MESLRMTEAPRTHPSLLVRLRDFHDRQAWHEFVDLYAPVVYGYARKRGLQNADAADLTQEVLSQVAEGIGRFDYDPRRGSFRGWLFTLVRRRLSDWRARRNGRSHGSGDPAVHHRLQEQAAPAAEESTAWEHEYRLGLFAWAAERVRPAVLETTWQAFWQTAVEGRSGKEVAADLSVSIAAVYLAKNRVMARLRKEIQQQLEEL
jgi:RNA polymerase sigma-70 factor (ECF subfamily)